MKDAQKKVNDEKIQLTANPFIVKEFRERGDKLSEEKDFEGALRMYTSAYMLDDSMENQMRYKMAEATVNGEDHVNITL